VGDLAVFNVTSWLLVFARVGATMMLLPAFGEETIPPRVRLVLALLVALSLVPIVADRFQDDLSGDALSLAIVREAAIGLVLGTLVRILYLSIAMAGSIIATQAGFSMVTALDPAMGGQAPTIARLVSVAAIVFMFALNIHHLLIAGLAKSYAMELPGLSTIGRDLPTIAVATIARSFEISLQIAAPFLVFGLVINVGMGLIGRLSPTIQIFFIAQPFVLLAGIGLMLACLAGGIALWARLFGSTITTALG